MNTNSTNDELVQNNLYDLLTRVEHKLYHLPFSIFVSSSSESMIRYCFSNFLRSRGRLGIDFRAEGGHFGDQNDDFESMGPLGTIWGVPELPWAAQVMQKSQNLVRGSPKGNPK